MGLNSPQIIKDVYSVSSTDDEISFGEIKYQFDTNPKTIKELLDFIRDKCP